MNKFITSVLKFSSSAVLKVTDSMRQIDGLRQECDLYCFIFSVVIDELTGEPMSKSLHVVSSFKACYIHLI